ncbi:MAG: LysE family transporter [Acidobacteriota bacterium]|nr:LysE family transporter [Acidobacteriota bacterium]
MIVAFIAGLIMSFLGSIIPTGPIALIVIRRSIAGRSLGVLSLVSGAAVAESGYALLAYLGIDFALSQYPLQTSILRMVAGIILIAFAMVCIFGHHLPMPDRESRKYAGANFLLGLSIAGLNPTFLVTWTGAVAVVRGAGLISGIHAAPAFALGVIVGPIVWFWILIKILRRHVEDVHPDILKKIEQALPIVLLILAAIMLWQAVYLLLHQG